ncbi:HNH endonuclease [Vibrio mediterranei]|uniref:HNH endonuclease n=1 Tax=Vibrio mediterranei TaxID=689 RepID=UPI001EFC6B83|nr:HNH endonuclease [Vibrio mediterranei]MCG9659448.1 HNH endonuclease [Vibrio mediterranei]
MSTDSLDLNALSSTLSERREYLGISEALYSEELRFSYLFSKSSGIFDFKYKVLASEARIVCSIELDSILLELKEKILTLLCFGDFSFYSEHGRYFCEIWKNDRKIRAHGKYEKLLSMDDLRLEVVSRPCSVDSTNCATDEVLSITSCFVRWFETEVIDIPLTGDEEGASFDTSHTRYERSQRNRDICIRYHGTTCVVCSTTLSDIYGDIANNFIHVHHLTKVSQSGKKVVNPIKDLIPVCPNCHSIIHLREEPYSPEELKNIIQLKRCQ